MADDEQQPLVDTDDEQQPLVPKRAGGPSRGLVFVAIDPDLIGDGDAFRASVRQIIDESLRLPPMRGTDEAALPGTMEYRRENERRVGGIPMPEDHREMLEGVAAELGVAPPPWAARPRL